MSVEGLADFRHEWKIMITELDRRILQGRLQEILEPDPYSLDGRGLYFIRSLYFDNAEDTALREKLDGVNRRAKFRIRYYNNDWSFIRLEKKAKWNGVGNKSEAPLSVEQTRQIIAGDLDWMPDSDQPVIQELYYQMITKGLVPKTIVDYTREAYVYEAGGVRVTLDYNLRTGLRNTDLFDPDVPTVPAPDSPMVMEVKWDEFLPDIVRAAVQLPGRRPTSFSKYAACRAYD